MDKLIAFEITDTSWRVSSVQGVRQSIVTLKGRCLHQVTCEYCSCLYEYDDQDKTDMSTYTILGLGEDKARDEAVERATTKLKTKMSRPLLVRCPDCAKLQPEMAARRKRTLIMLAIKLTIVGTFSGLLIAALMWAARVNPPGG